MSTITGVVRKKLSPPLIAFLIAVSLFLISAIFFSRGQGLDSTLARAQNILRIAAFLGIIAAGQTLVIISGGEGIDLSVGATVTLSRLMNLEGLKRHAGPFLFLVFVFPFLILDLSAFPPIWFDEGWVLSLARNWSEYGHYGLYLEGMPVSGSMVNVGFPFVAPIAFSFHWFGVGIFQARLVAIFFTISASFALYAMTKRLYGAKSALCALVLSVTLAPSPALNPLIAGRQTLGEVPMLFFVLAGFISYSYAWRRPFIFADT